MALPPLYPSNSTLAKPPQSLAARHNRWGRQKAAGTIYPRLTNPGLLGGAEPESRRIPEHTDHLRCSSPGAFPVPSGQTTKSTPATCRIRFIRRTSDWAPGRPCPSTRCRRPSRSGGADTVSPPGSAPPAPPGPEEPPTAAGGPPRVQTQPVEVALPAGGRPTAPRAPAHTADARGRARPPARARRGAPTGPRTRPRSSPPAGRARLPPQRAAEASGARQQRLGAPPWNSEASPRAASPGLAAGSRSSGLCAAHSLARRADYKSHKAVRLCVPGLVVRPHPLRAGGREWSAGKDPTPSFTTNSAAQSPWKKINKHLLDTVIFNTYS